MKPNFVKAIDLLGLELETNFNKRPTCRLGATKPNYIKPIDKLGLEPKINLSTNVQLYLS